ncbi:acetoacetate metabolism regulatory protein AtoC [Desulfosarcina ovata subsp. sediminis]|uniref:Acetoacetate metabolism regulatory protein AtoC n=1 Tax=Desulfosarcina ovata subsp. sediminis TaxID=885957 RepID=A0A5K7ZHG7_9BACT|nr:sigma-54 dependent transcriptional regulator [Desulfosarcina ovata]BBO80301.1 acetoacetate metabolism regulatory protein AtoC [Desulfosarcina ovata subsp. sediminis]
MKNYKVLFVDDDEQILSIVQQFLSRSGFDVTTESNGLKAIEMVREHHFSVVFTDLIMPEISGMDLLKRIKAISPDTEVIVVSGYGTIESAIEAMKLGSYDFLQKPINFDRFRILIERIIEKQDLKEENQRIRSHLKERYKYDELVGMSPKMQDIYEIIDKISTGSPTVLIEGESGTGKGLTANIIHNNSDRHQGPFIPVNCGAIAESLLERELFGHVKGAFTGALKDTVGLFQAADGGTIFLDEIAEVSQAVQVTLLRVLQEKKVRRLGDTRETDIDVRVIAATNKKLDEALKKQTFREDLYYRLNVISITMPPLRDIREDIPLLVNHFIAKYSTSQASGPKVSPAAMGKLMGYHWPGNVRQLENVIQRAFALGVRETLNVEDLPNEIVNQAPGNLSTDKNFNLREIEKKVILQALGKVGGNKVEAAKLLGINATTVYRKMAKYNIADVQN